MRKVFLLILVTLSLLILTGCTVRFVEPGIYQTAPQQQCYQNNLGQVWCENTLLLAPVPSIGLFIGNDNHHSYHGGGYQGPTPFETALGRGALKQPRGESRGTRGGRGFR